MRRILFRPLLAAIVAMITAVGASAEAQGVQPGSAEINGRTVVMIPPLNGPQGPRVGSVLRGLITDDDKFAALDDRAVRTTMSQYSVAALDSITARQLAPLAPLRAKIVSWGTITQDGRAFRAEIKFIDTANGDEIAVTANGANPNELAAAIFSGFKERMEGMMLGATCNIQLADMQFQQAVAAADQALVSVPTSTGISLCRARALYSLERFAEALTAFNRVLELDQSNQDALLGAGLSASEQSQSVQAMTFYGRHIELNGNTTQARRALAAEIIPTADLASAFKVLEPAAAENRSDVEFQRSFFQLAVAAGTEAKTDARTPADSAAADRMLEGALMAYAAAFPGGAGLDGQNLLRAVSVALSLNRADVALRMAREGTERFPNEAQIWSNYAALLHDANQPVESLAALTRVIAIDPAFPNAYLLRGLGYLESLQMDLAIADFRNAARNGDGDRVAQQLVNMANPYLQPISANYAEAEKLLTPALEFVTSPALRTEISFFLGLSIYQQVSPMMQAKPNDIPTYRAAVGYMERALPLIEGSGHASATPQLIDGLKENISKMQTVLRGR